ncbi:MAG: hypothetical protein QME94_01500 [Anaerolineae bacterium]|nr:hypothetical protein [Anaerolineae bacterium]
MPLFESEYRQLQDAYFDLFRRAGLPLTEADRRAIAVADFGLSTPGERDSSDRLGVLEVHLAPFCMKLLAWLPLDTLPEHRHQSVLLLPPGSAMPEGFTRLEACVRGFKPRPIDPPGSIYAVPRDPFYSFPIDSSGQEVPPEGVTGRIIRGKWEKFTPILGEATIYTPRDHVLRGDGKAEYVRDPSGVKPASAGRFRPPKRDWETMLSRYAVELAVDEAKGLVGSSFLLTCNTPHLVVAGPTGFVCIESSLESFDEADVYTRHEEVVRATQIVPD